jgi:hypothetical protein
MINFFKRSLSAEILRDIQQYQSQPYNLTKCGVVYDYIMQCLDETDKRTDDLYELSLQLEPREKDDERVARLLQDSVSVLTVHMTTLSPIVTSFTYSCIHSFTYSLFHPSTRSHCPNRD